MSLKDSLVAVLVALLWGAQVTAVKIGGAELPPILMVAMRFAIIAAILVPFVGVPSRDKAFPAIAIATLTGALHFGLLYAGISRVDASTSAIAYQVATPFTVLLAFVFLKEKIAPTVLVGIGVAFAGVVTVMGGVGKGGEMLGVVLVILAALGFATGTVLTKHIGSFDPLKMNGWIALIAAPELLVISVGLEYEQWATLADASMSAWAALLYTALSGGLLGFGLWYWLLRRHPISQLSPFTLLVPIFAVAVSQLMLDEPFTANLMIGGVVTVLGVALCQLTVKKTPLKAEPSSGEATPEANKSAA